MSGSLGLVRRSHLAIVLFAWKSKSLTVFLQGRGLIQVVKP
jgi:hypothetical protein